MKKNEILKQASFDTQNGVKVLKIKGSPYEMGYQHGFLLADKIDLMINRTLLATTAYVAAQTGSDIKTAEKFLWLGQKAAEPFLPAILILAFFVGPSDALISIFPFSNGHIFLWCNFTRKVCICGMGCNCLLMHVSSKTRFLVKSVLYYYLMAKEKLKKVSNSSLKKRIKERYRKNPLKIFTFDSLITELHKVLETFPDNRASNSSKSLKDAALGGFALFYTQNPSFLSYQKSMQKNKGKNNAASLFGIEEILSSNQIRNILDTVAPSHAFGMFSHIFSGLNYSGHLDRFRSFNENLVVSVDGVRYFNSKNIDCQNCHHTHHSNGSITYSHSMVTPVIVKPGINQVISLIPEFITPQDGHEKQDCENAAAKRWLSTYGPTLKPLGITITGDDLYSRQPLCQAILDEGLDFILVCKEESHKTLYEYLDFLKEDVTTIEVGQWVGQKHLISTYRFYNQVPLRDGKDALQVNWCEIVTIEEASGKLVFRNAYITNFVINKENVADITADGRARWKVENENNNVLKTKGYHLEHNFGHGQKNLAALLITFNLLAFLFHTVLELMDQKYKAIRTALPTRETFFQDLRALTRYIYFDGWAAILSFMIDGLELNLPEVLDTS